MKNLQKAQRSPLGDIYQKVNARAPFSEQEVLALQDAFLAPGFHCLKVSDIEVGRILLDTFMLSLNHFSRVGILSSEKVPMNYVDIYEDIAAQILSGNQKTLDDYMLNTFSYDFVAIEGTKEMLYDPLYGKFEQLLLDYSITHTIPVVTFFYETIK